MRYVLMIVGYGWALMGLIGIFLPVDPVDPDLAAIGITTTDIAVAGIMMNIMLGILPGLVVGGIGSIMSSKEKQS